VTSPYATMTRRSDVGATPRVVSPWSPNELVAVIVGSVYLVAGIVAGAITLGTTMAVSDDPAPGISHVRTMSYLGLGLVLLLATGRGRAKSANTVLGAAYLIVGVVLPILGQPGCGLLTLNHPECAIQLSTAALLLGFGRTQD
jgi:hypothetical protein